MTKTLLALSAIAVSLAACSEQTPAPETRSALFDDYPTKLFKTFEVSCDGPGDKFSHASNDRFECRSPLPLDTTAFLILNYDGHAQDLPTGVRRMSSTRLGKSYRVDAELFFLVPQKDGASVKVPVRSHELDRQLIQLYRYFGGSPI
ncbi:putative lipoprotein [Ruegeria lacuscaerulensis ITI-1157]|nr:putative lipoprotein [Ruegeria lacuscaerulensis ITI-1157]SHJ21529.1 hypothetical protein SAMN05444404_1712 [Ruegeria lacuscaerulensis ITI-1157]